MASTALRENPLTTTAHAIATDQDGLARNWVQFDEPPPPTYSNPSSPVPTLADLPPPRGGPSDEQQRIQSKLLHERNASTPHFQFEAQIQREREWISKTFARLRIQVSGACMSSASGIAEKKVAADWREQGIWNDSWVSGPPQSARWKHEHEPSLFGVSQTAEPEASRNVFGPSKTAKRRSQRSRPNHQFAHGLLREADRLNRFEGPSPDLYTRAYTSLKKFWVESEIWDERWGLMPGMFWKHELPFFEEFVNRCNGSQAYPAPFFSDDRPQPPSSADIKFWFGVPHDMRIYKAVWDADYCTYEPPSPTHGGHVVARDGVPDDQTHRPVVGGDNTDEESSQLGPHLFGPLPPGNPGPRSPSTMQPRSSPFMTSSESAGSSASHEDQQVASSPRPDERKRHDLFHRSFHPVRRPLTPKSIRLLHEFGDVSSEVAGASASHEDQQVASSPRPAHALPNNVGVSSNAAGGNAAREDQQDESNPSPNQRRVHASRVSKIRLQKGTARRGKRLLEAPAAASHGGSPRPPLPNILQITEATAKTPSRSPRLQAKKRTRTKASKARG